jgi:hypothetical protein
MRMVLLAISDDAIEKSLSFFRRLDADAEDLYLSCQISFPLVHEGRHLGPAPGSPTAAIEKNDRRGRRPEDSGKFHCLAVDVFEDC